MEHRKTVKIDFSPLETYRLIKEGGKFLRKEGEFSMKQIEYERSVEERKEGGSRDGGIIT